MRLNECFEKRLLRKERPDPEKSRRSIEVAQTKIDEAEKALGVDLTDTAVILAYTAMFHVARAVLFKDGVIEKSHVCLIEYLREKYVKTRRLSEALTNTLGRMRIDRHETLYGLETERSKKDAECSLQKAEEFLSTVKAMIA
jgi:uncharacterized protein (UPF0332 family)